MDAEKLRGPIYFLGFCILFAGCAASGVGNDTPNEHRNDYYPQLENIQNEVHNLKQEVQELKEILTEEESNDTSRTGTKITY